MLVFIPSAGTGSRLGHHTKYINKTLLPVGKLPVLSHIINFYPPKTELLIALSLIKDPKALLNCNGYKDQRYIETAILARKLGQQPVVVIEQISEVERIIAASKDRGLVFRNNEVLR